MVASKLGQFRSSSKAVEVHEYGVQNFDKTNIVVHIKSSGLRGPRIDFAAGCAEGNGPV